MEVRLNNKPLALPHPMSVAELIEMQNIPGAGTAVAVNGKIVRREDREMRMLNEGDDIIVISAAYGG